MTQQPIVWPKRDEHPSGRVNDPDTCPAASYTNLEPPPKKAQEDVGGRVFVYQRN